MNDNTIGVIGECMIEIRPVKTGDAYTGQVIRSDVAYGGDTLNSAMYMARQGTAVEYITMLGDDPMSDWMVNEWRREGVGCDLVRREPGAVPGLYLIDIDTAGERSFYYWRKDAPARRLFAEGKETEDLFQQMAGFESLYLSGITLSLYDEPTRQRLYDFFDGYRRRGGRVCFDNNYRPRQWPDREAARAAFEAIYRRTDIALPTLEDEYELFGDEREGAVIERLKSWGIGEIVVKLGESGCLVVDKSGVTRAPGNAVRKVVDTTAAGDSFNAGYLSPRFAGASVQAAAENGNRLASIVVQHRGAIIPRSAMPGVGPANQT